MDNVFALSGMAPAALRSYPVPVLFPIFTVICVQNNTFTFQRCVYPLAYTDIEARRPSMQAGFQREHTFPNLISVDGRLVCGDL